jgi:hypothetical protein
VPIPSASQLILNFIHNKSNKRSCICEKQIANFDTQT